MINAWREWYKDIPADAPPGAFRYGDTCTYEIAAEFLADCAEVEDRGCGLGGFKRFCKTRYIGVDGTRTPHVDVQADLRTYRSQAEGILLRHVLEHNYDWADVLACALASATKKLVLVLFTPMVARTQEIAHNAQHGVDVPDIAFAERDIERALGTRAWSCQTLKTATGYGVETIYRVWV